MEQGCPYAGDVASVLSSFQTFKRKMLRLLGPVLQAEGLTAPQVCVLLMLAERECSVGDISARIYMGQANTSSLCKKMERDGYLTRTRDSGDRRVVHLSITQKGTESVERVQRNLRQDFALLHQLPPQVKEDIARGVRAVDTTLDYLYEHRNPKGE